jgi:hypothetical protein
MTDECRPSHRTARRSSARCYCWCIAGRASTEAFGRKAAAQLDCSGRAATAGSAWQRRVFGLGFMRLLPSPVDRWLGNCREPCQQVRARGFRGSMRPNIAPRGGQQVNTGVGDQPAMPRGIASSGLPGSLLTDTSLRLRSVSRCSAGFGANPRAARENKQDCCKEATGDS